MELITLKAKREGENVVLYNPDGTHKATFPKRGYRPTRATKIVTLNCFKYRIEWD